MSNRVIFIVGRQRSGTTVLRELLTAHGAMNADEVFHGDLSKPYRFYNYVYERVRENPANIHPNVHGALFRDFVGHLLRVAADKPVAIDVKYFAFNLIPLGSDTLHNRSFVAEYMRTSGARVFHVIRRNKLRVLISEELARQTGVWSAQKKGQLPEAKRPLQLGPEHVLKRLNALVAEDERASQLLRNVNRTVLHYEEMFDRSGMFTPEVTAAAEGALGLARVDPKPANMRMNPEPFEELVANYAELRRALTNSPFEWMLEETAAPFHHPPGAIASAPAALR